MYKTITVTLILLFVSITMANISFERGLHLPSDYNLCPKEKHLRELVRIFAHVESNTNSTVWCKKEDAAGLLQIRPIMIKEANRIAKCNKYSLNDRWDISKSVEIFILVQKHKNPNLNLVKAAKIWNAGKANVSDDYIKPYLRKILKAASEMNYQKFSSTIS